jgi:hypothetical protein
MLMLQLLLNIHYIKFIYYYNNCLLISLFDLRPFTLRCFHRSTSIWYHWLLFLFFFYLGLLLLLWHFLLFDFLLHLVHHGSRFIYFMIIVVIIILNLFRSFHLFLCSPVGLIVKFFDFFIIFLGIFFNLYHFFFFFTIEIIIIGKAH